MAGEPSEGNRHDLFIDRGPEFLPEAMGNLRHRRPSIAVTPDAGHDWTKAKSLVALEVVDESLIGQRWHQEAPASRSRFHVSSGPRIASCRPATKRITATSIPPTSPASKPRMRRP